MGIKKEIKNFLSRRNLSLFIVILMVSSALLSFVIYASENKGGGEKKIGLIVDFGRGYRYPMQSGSGNESAFDILRSKVSSVHLDVETIDCINGICNSNENEWIFVINGEETNQTPMEFFPTGFDVLEFKYKNTNETNENINETIR